MSGHVLLNDDFSGYPEGVEVVPYSYVRRIGPWETRNIDYAWRLGSGGYQGQSQTWGVRRQGGRSVLVQPEPNFQSYICAGLDSWRNYRFEASFRYESVSGTLGSSYGCNHDNERLLTGLLARYQTQRHHYFWGADALGRPLLAKRVEEELVELFRGTVASEGGVSRRWAIEVQDQTIRGYLDGALVAEVHDDAYGIGQVGFRTDRPAEFAAVLVTASMRPDPPPRRSATRFTPPRVWRTLTRAGGWNHLRFADLDDSGSARIVHVNGIAGPDDAVPAVEVLSLADEPLWRRGDWLCSGPPQHVAMCVADLAGNGRPRLVLGYGRTVEVLDALTGRTLHRRTLDLGRHRCSPDARPAIGHLFAARLRAGPERQVIALSSSHAVALDGELKPIWEHTGNLGHGPAVGDLDGDGVDEVMLGYSLLSGDGRVRWSVPGLDAMINSDLLDAHADWTEFVRIPPGNSRQILLAASQKGLFLLDAEGHVLWRRVMGHVQMFATGAFAPDGLGIVAATLWESAGIYCLFDAAGTLLRRWELPIFSPLYRLRRPDAERILLTEYNRMPALLDASGTILWQAEGTRSCRRLRKNNEPPFHSREFEDDLFSTCDFDELVLFA